MRHFTVSALQALTFVHIKQHPSAQPKDIKPKVVKEAGITQDLYLMNSKFEGAYNNETDHLHEGKNL